MTSFKQTTLATALIVCTAAMIACDGRRGKMEDATFRVETASLEKTDVKKIDSFGLPEAKEFTLKACLTDSASLSPVSISSFSISDGKSFKTAIADKDGCITWKEIHHFSSLQKQRSLKMDRTFRSEKLYSGAVTVSFSFNPWQETLVDLRKASDPDLEASEQSVVGFDMTSQETITALGGYGGDLFSTAAMADVKLTFNGYDDRKTVITNLLTLKPAQRFRLSLKPQFLQRNIKNEESLVDLKGGKFQLRLAIISSDADGKPKSADIVAHSDAEIDVRPTGLAQKDIILKVHDISALLSRNQFILIMQPMGDIKKLVKPGVFIGTVGVLVGSDASVDLVPYEGDADGFIASVGTAIDGVDRETKPIDLLRSVSGFSEEKPGSALYSLINSSSEGARAALRALCERLYGENDVSQMVVKRGIFKIERTIPIKSRSGCAEDPNQFLILEKHDVIDKITSSPSVESYGTPRVITMNKELKLAKSSKDEQTRETSGEFGVNIGLDTNLLDSPLGLVSAPLQSFAKAFGASIGLKASYGGNWLRSTSLDRTDSVDMSEVITEKEDFNVSSVSYSFTASVNECVFLKAKDSKVPGYFACSETLKEKQASEVYYQINHSIQNSAFVDALSANASPWRTLIRGKSNYKAFEKLMTQEFGVLKFKEFKIKNTDANLLPDFKINQSFPGVLSSQ